MLYVECAGAGLQERCRLTCSLLLCAACSLCWCRGSAHLHRRRCRGRQRSGRSRRGRGATGNVAQTGTGRRAARTTAAASGRERPSALGRSGCRRRRGAGRHPRRGAGRHPPRPTGVGPPRHAAAGAFPNSQLLVIIRCISLTGKLTLLLFFIHAVKTAKMGINKNAARLLQWIISFYCPDRYL